MIQKERARSFILFFTILSLFTSGITVFNATTDAGTAPARPASVLLSEDMACPSAPATVQEFCAAFEYAAVNHLDTMTFTYHYDEAKEIPVKEIFSQLRQAQSICRWGLPEYFCYRGTLSSTIRYSRGVLTVIVKWQYTNEDREKETATLANARGVLEGLYGSGALVPGMTETQRAQGILHWLIAHTTYDVSATDCHSPWAVFASGKGVCDAYTSAYDLLLKLDGIQCRGLYGQMLDGGDHLWTVATLDGTEVHIDATWADSNGDANAYFALSAAEMAKDHLWEGMPK